MIHFFFYTLSYHMQTVINNKHPEYGLLLVGREAINMLSTDITFGVIYYERKKWRKGWRQNKGILRLLLLAG